MCLQDVKVPATAGCMVDGIMDQEEESKPRENLGVETEPEKEGLVVST